MVNNDRATGCLIDVKSMLDKEEAKKWGIDLRRL